jgi:hypothetical protein
MRGNGMAEFVLKKVASTLDGANKTQKKKPVKKNKTKKVNK